MSTLAVHRPSGRRLNTRSLNGGPGRGRQPAKIDRDEDLVTGLRDREREAAEVLVARYADRLYRLAIRITGSEQDAEEVVQDALWTATRKIDTFRGDSALGTWLHRIAVNAANQKRRARRSRRNEVSRDDLFFGGQAQPGAPASDWSAKMEDPALQMELRRVLTSAIDDMRVASRCGRSLESRDLRSTARQSEHGQVTRPSRAPVPARPPGRIHDRGARRRPRGFSQFVLSPPSSRGDRHE